MKDTIRHPLYIDLPETELEVDAEFEFDFEEEEDEAPSYSYGLIRSTKYMTCDCTLVWAQVGEARLSRETIESIMTKGALHKQEAHLADKLLQERGG